MPHPVFDRALNKMDYVSDKKMKIFLKGAGIGITGSIISATSGRITGSRLGYSPMTLESTFKVALASGVSTLAFMAGYDYMEGWNRKT